MTVEEKLLENVRDWFIAKDGQNFLKLSEKDQNNLILAAIRGLAEKSKAEK